MFLLLLHRGFRYYQCKCCVNSKFVVSSAKIVKSKALCIRRIIPKYVRTNFFEVRLLSMCLQFLWISPIEKPNFEIHRWQATRVVPYFERFGTWRQRHFLVTELTFIVAVSLRIVSKLITSTQLWNRLNRYEISHLLVNEACVPQKCNMIVNRSATESYTMHVPSQRKIIRLV